MKASDRYLKIVEWSDEDKCYIGRAPGLALGGVHGRNELSVYKDICRVVDEIVAFHEKDGLSLPAPTTGKKFSGKFNLRVGKELHERLVIASLKASESLNSFCVKVLKSNVDPM